MKRKFSRGAWVFLGVSATLLATALSAERIRPIPLPDTRELAAVRAEHAEFAAYSDDALAKLRKEVAAHPAPRWTDTTAKSWLESSAEGWSHAWHTESVTLTKTASTLSDWPACLAALRTWTTRPGVLLESIDLAADGTGSGRTFSRLSVRLRFALSTAQPKQP